MNPAILAAHALPRLASRVFNTPLLATPEAAVAIANVFAERIGIAPLDIAASAPSLAVEDRDAPYDLDDDGIATIPIHGELVNRGSWLDAYSGLTSYKTLTASLDTAANDYRVRGIALDIDSPGGEAAGAMETAARIREITAAKPVVAYVDSLAASAAYWLASGADEIIATPSATLGSIGVVYLHLDRSEAMKDRGIRASLLHEGAFKVDGNSMQPLPDDARARIQAQLREVYNLFTESVGRHRPDLGAKGARKTEAGIFIGQRAVEAGLADRIGGPETLKAAFPRKTFWSANMPNERTYSEAEHNSALETARREADARTATAVAEARTAERTRIRSILDSDPAKGRQTLARHLALSSDMAPEAAQAVLGAAAPEAPPKPSRMDLVPAVDVRPGSTQRSENPQADIDASWSDIVKSQHARRVA